MPDVADMSVYRGGGETRTNPPPPSDPVGERLARLEAVLPTLATRADVAAVRGDFSHYMLGTILSIIGVLLAGLVGIAQIMKPDPPPAPAPAPVVIQVPGSVSSAPPPGSTAAPPPSR